MIRFEQVLSFVIFTKHGYREITLICTLQMMDLNNNHIGYNLLLHRNDIKVIHSFLKNFLTKLRLMDTRYRQYVRRLNNGNDQLSTDNHIYQNLHKQLLKQKNF